jgi:hypothetical protein
MGNVHHHKNKDPNRVHSDAGSWNNTSDHPRRNSPPLDSGSKRSLAQVVASIEFRNRPNRSPPIDRLATGRMASSWS